MPDGDIASEPRTVSTAELTQIVRAFADSDLSELRLAVGDVELLVSRNDHVDVAGHAGAGVPARTPVAATAAATSAATPAPSAVTPPAGPPVAVDTPPVDRTGLIPVRSPAVGVFYRRPGPDKPPFAEVGSTVAVGDPVGTIEVMKMFTTVTSEVAGTVAEICVEDAVLVEYGQTIMYLTAPAGA